MANVIDKVAGLVVGPQGPQGPQGPKGDTGEVSQEQFDDALALKANKNGSYSELTAGTAEQLASTVFIEDNTPYIIRKSGGGAAVGHEKYEQIVGGSLVWNQLCNSDSVTTIKEHKYYVVRNNSASVEESDGSTIMDLTSGTDMVFDLSLMFGSAIADYIYALECSRTGDGAAWVKRFFPNDYYEYNAGEIKSVSGLSEHKTVGFNAWDEEWEPGYYNSSGQPHDGAQYIRSKNYISVIPGVPYYFKTGGAKMYYCTYNQAKEFLMARPSVTDRAVTFSANVRYIRFNMENTYGTTYKNDICINLSHGGERDGQYESYDGHSYPLDDSIMLRGIPKLSDNNNFYYANGDTYDSNGTVTRRNSIVDLGTLTWQISGSGESAFFYSTDSIGVKTGTDNALCSRYVISEVSSENTVDKCFSITKDPQIRIRDTDYTDATAFKAAMNGVMLVYKLASNTTEQAQAYTNPQAVDNSGTEEYVTDSIVPVGHVTKYANNLRAKLEMAPNSPDRDGDYVLRQTEGSDKYIPLGSVAVIQDFRESISDHEKRIATNTDDIAQLKSDLAIAYQTKTITREYVGASVIPFAVSNGDTLKIKNDTSNDLVVRLRETAESTTNLQVITIPANTTAFKTATANAPYLSVYFNAVGTATIENGSIITLDAAEIKTSRKLNTYTGASDVDLSAAVQGAYLYDGSLNDSANYKRLDIALGDAVAVNIIGSTANAFCLYHFLNASGKIIKSNANTATQTNYNLFLEVPETAETLRFSFQVAEESAVALFGLTAKDQAVINASKDTAEINLANARDGGYSYDGNFHPTSTTYKYAEIDVRGYKQIHLIGTTQNAFCLWRIIDTYGNMIESAEWVNNDKTAYDVLIDIPLTAKSVLFTFNKNEYAYAELIALSDGYVKNVGDDFSYVHDVQKSIAEEWCFPFVDVGDLGFGYRHIIPETARLWSSSGTKDLNQISALMSDGVHPFFGDGLVLMYGADVARQMALIPPAYASLDTIQTNMWQGKTILWLGTSIPAGSDPSAGSGAAYPDIVAEQLGANVINQARGSSCVRINSSQGDYKNMYYPHFLRSLSRMVSEVDDIVAKWSTIQPNITGAPSTLSADEIATMKAHSYENLLLPYLDGTNAMPDVFVIDHGHNDRRPKGYDGGYDMYIDSTYENIMTGEIADDTWMTANNYANLKIALNSDLDKVGIISDFASSLNRNTFKGAMNFIITLILRYNPKARIIIISEYN